MRRKKEVQAPADSGKKTQKTAQINDDERVEMTFKRPPDGLYQKIVTSPETGIILLAKSNKCKLSAIMGLNLLPMFPVTSFFDNQNGPKLVQAYVQDSSWLESICQRDTPEIRGAPNKKLTMSGTITLHLWIVEPRTQVKLDIMENANTSTIRNYLHWQRGIVNPSGRKENCLTLLTATTPFHG